MDGARVAAAAISWLCDQPPPRDMDSGIPQGPEALLSHLREVSRTDDMKSKLDLIQKEVLQVCGRGPDPEGGVPGVRRGTNALCSLFDANKTECLKH